MFDLPDFPGFNQLYFGNTLEQYFVFLVFIAIGFILGKVAVFIIDNILKRLTAKTKSEIDDILLEIVEKPIPVLVILIFAFFGYQFLTFSPEIDSIFLNLLNVILIVVITLSLVAGIDKLIKAFVVPLTEKTDSKLDDQLIPILTKVSKAIVIVLALVVIFSSFGYDLTAVIAGLGIGGLAFAFAAKETIADAFGGLSLFTSRPFVVGDIIEAAGVMGTVKEIGLRYTRIKDFDKRLIVVPNSKLANAIIKNISSEPEKRVKTKLGLVYSTSTKQMEKALQILKSIAKKHKGVDNDSYARFSGFGDSSLDITFIYYVTDLDNKFDVISEINFEIKKEFEKSKLEFAYPTQTIHLEK